MARFQLDETQLDAWLEQRFGNTHPCTVRRAIAELKEQTGYFHLELGTNVTFRIRGFQRSAWRSMELGQGLVETRNPIDLTPILEGRQLAPTRTTSTTRTTRTTRTFATSTGSTRASSGPSSPSSAPSARRSTVPRS